jgi:hypothetical protein
MDLYLAEYDYQVEDFTAPGEAEKGLWVALGPSAMHYLSRRGISYRIPEDFISREEIEGACVAQFEVLTRICRELDNTLLNGDVFLEKWEIRPFFFHLWQLGQLLDLLLRRSLTLKKIFADFPGSRVHVHSGASQSWGLFGLGFALEENLWGQLLTLPGWGPQIRCRPERLNGINPQKELRLSHTGLRRSTLKTFLSSLSRITPLCHSVRQSIIEDWWRNLWNILGPGKLRRQGGALVCNGLYEWAGILPDLIARGYPVYFLYAQDLQKRNSLPESFRRAGPANLKPLGDRFRKAFPQWPVDLTPLIQDRFDFINEKAPLTAQAVVKKMEEFLSGKKIKALLISTGVDFCSYVVKQYCQKKNIRVLSWQHGAQWYDKRLTQRNDLLNLVGCDLMLVYGEAVKNGYRSSPLAEAEKCQLVSIGMPSLESLRAVPSVQSEGKMRILWVYGGYYKNSWYCGFSPPQSDGIYYQEQIVILQNILELEKKYKQVSVTVKLYHSAVFNPPWVNELANREKIRIVIEKPSFVELLPQHDLVIVDSPTTTLLQAVATKLPVFVLMSVIRWPDEAISLLRKRAYCAESAEDLMKGLKQFLENGTRLFDVSNEEFLKQYATHDGNGKKVALSLTEMILNDEKSI